jgi:hypothetical protein
MFGGSAGPAVCRSPALAAQPRPSRRCVRCAHVRRPVRVRRPVFVGRMPVLPGEAVDPSGLARNLQGTCEEAALPWVGMAASWRLDRGAPGREI